MRKIKYIGVHCSATREGQHFTVEDINEWHRKRGFSAVYNGKEYNIGYHIVIYLDGSVHYGRPLELAGAHITGYNAESIGICYIGGLDKDGNPKDTRTPEQKAALETELKKLMALFPSAVIWGHRDFSPDKNGNGLVEPFEWLKACPCFDVISEHYHFQLPEVVVTPKK